jgi:hypothetical protein
MPAQGLVPFWGLFILLAGAEPLQTTIKPAVPPPPGTRHFFVQVRILEIDEHGRATTVATPTVQTTGAAAGVTVDSERGRRFEFHFSATEAGAPSPLPVVLADEPTVPKPIAVTASVDTDAGRVNAPRITLKVTQQPRKAVLQAIARQAGLNLALDPDTAIAVTTALSAPITCDYDNSPLDKVLRQILNPAKLRAQIESGFLLISAEVSAAESIATESWQVRVYDVSDLVPKDTSGRPEFEPLIRRLRTDVLAASWDGEATVRGFDSTQSLVIRQTNAGHEAVANYLASLRKPLSKPAPQGSAP